MKTLNAFRAACAATVALLLAGCGGDDDGASQPVASATERTTVYGVVAGTDDTATNGTYSWKGIPFARPPTGGLRWRAPVEPVAWATPRAATQFANACVQSGRLYGPGANNRYDATIGATLGQTVGSEDCLYLNVWRPATATAGLPVIVFFHGGSNITGYTADPVYDGAALAKTANAVVVTVNYRLGIFGFLNLAQFKTGADPLDDSGNFALLDLVQALRFVNRNVGAFGGDPGNVTAMGQSAGATNLYALLASPLVVAANPALIHRAVPLSGGLSLASNLPAGSIPALSPAAASAAQGSALLSNALIADGTVADAAAARAYVAAATAADVSAYLRTKSADALLTTVLTRLTPLGLSGSNPIPDGNVLPVDPIAAITAGRYLKVPVLAGNTRDEARLFPTFLALSPALGGVSGRLLDDATVFSIVFGYDPNAAPTTTIGQWIPAVYLPAATPLTGFIARTDALNRIFFLVNRDNILNPIQAQQAGVWYFRFDWDEEPAPFNDIFGAAHGIEMPFVFGNFGPSLYANFMNTTANRPGRLALSDTMMKSLGAFARNGDPNDAALGVAWPVWPATLVFDATPTAIRITVQ